MRFDTPGLAGSRADLRAGVRHRAPELLLDRPGLVEDVERALLRGARRRHLPGRLLEVHDPRADLGDAPLGDHEQPLAEAGVDAARDVAHELEVLALVLPHRHLVGAVGEHVGRHEHRVEEQPGGDELALRDATCRGTGACG